MKAAYRINIIWRITTIFLFGAAGFLVLSYTAFWLLAGWLILFCLLAIFELVRFVERDRRSLLNFLIAVNQNDFMGNVGVSKDQKFLYQAYKSLSSKYHQIATEKEANHLFLNTIVENAGVPMLAYEEEKQEVVLLNDGAKELFNKPYFRSITAIEKIDPELYEVIKHLENDEKKLHRFSVDGSWKELSVVAKRLILRNKWYKLVALQNIKSELDERELESWQKLIRVLTHEIKNSVIPISTLTEVINEMLINEDGEPVSLESISEEDEEDLRIGLKTISKRSKGLASFVNAYGDIAKIPVPNLQETNLSELLNGIIALEKQVAASRSVTIQSEFPTEEIITQLDPDLIEQVLINLIKNAIEALEGGGEIKIYLNRSLNEVSIAISDNGSGIPQDILENIFVPFYTTKKEGSGIGLSLSRQIIRKHHGDIQVSTQIKKGTTFTITLPIS
ncbi:MAG: sensor histidine kinase [bacterium]|nr:sensor histidine kinase [bacterium]